MSEQINDSEDMEEDRPLNTDTRSYPTLVASMKANYTMENPQTNSKHLNNRKINQSNASDAIQNKERPVQSMRNIIIEKIKKEFNTKATDEEIEGCYGSVIK